MSAPDLPYSEPLRLHQIGTGVTRTLEPDAAARGRIAKALDLASLDSFVADMTLAPSPGGWRLTGRVKARLAQTCGITLEPLPVEIDAPFAVPLAVVTHSRHHDRRTVVPAHGVERNQNWG